MGINENPLKVLTIEEYKKFKSDDKFLCGVAFAHGVQGWEGFNKSLTFYTIAKFDFKVSSEIQEIAKQDYKETKNKIINSIKPNELVFVGMGMDFKPRNKNYIGNHRIRTYFKDNEGVLCFVEFGASMNKDFLRCDHALKDTEKGNTRTLKERDLREKRIFNLEGLRGDNIKYTKDNILKLINKNFETNFNKVKVYSYFINTEDYNSISKE